MANRRMISKSISVSEQVNGMTLLARLLFTWMIPHTDDWGRMAGASRTIRALVIPLVDATDAEVEAALSEIESAGLIRRYCNGGSQFLSFPKWEDHQGGLHKRTASKYPEPPATPVGFPEVPGSSRLVRARGREEKRTKGKGTKEKRSTADKPPSLPEALAAWRETWKRKLSTKIDIPDKDATHLMKLLRLGESVADLTMVMDYYVKNEEYAWADWNLATMCGPRYAGMKAKAQSVPGQVGATSKFDEPYEEYLRQQEADSEVGNTGPT